MLSVTRCYRGLSTRRLWVDKPWKGRAGRPWLGEQRGPFRSTDPPSLSSQCLSLWFGWVIPWSEVWGGGGGPEICVGGQRWFGGGLHLCRREGEESFQGALEAL